MRTISMKNDDGSTTVKLEICTSEVFTPEFIQLVQDTLVATANKKIGDGDTYFTPEELSAEVAEVMVPCVVEALKRSLMLGLVRIAQDPGASYEGVFGKDEEEDESKHE